MSSETSKLSLIITDNSPGLLMRQLTTIILTLLLTCNFNLYAQEKCPSFIGVKGTRLALGKKNLRCFSSFKRAKRKGFSEKGPKRNFSGQWVFEGDFIGEDCEGEFASEPPTDFASLLNLIQIGNLVVMVDCDEDTDPDCLPAHFIGQATNKSIEAQSGAFRGQTKCLDGTSPIFSRFTYSLNNFSRQNGFDANFSVLAFCPSNPSENCSLDYRGTFQPFQGNARTAQSYSKTMRIFEKQ